MRGNAGIQGALVQLNYENFAGFAKPRKTTAFLLRLIR